MIEVFSDGRLTLWNGNALRFLSECPASQYSALVTDPPYSSGGMVRGDRMADTRDKYACNDSQTADEIGGFSGDNRDQRAFTQWCAWWMEMALDVVKPQGYCAVFVDWRQLASMIDAVQMGGWVFRGIVPWDKTGAARPVGGRFTAQCEYAVIASNGPMPMDMKPGALCPAGIISEPLVHSSRRHHITEKPVAVMRHLMALVPPGGCVLDPFAGSASTLLAARDLGLTAHGVELDAKVARRAVSRLRNAPQILDFEGAA